MAVTSLIAALYIWNYREYASLSYYFVCLGETLADVSGRKLEKLLSKAQHRGRHRSSDASLRGIQQAAVCHISKSTCYQAESS